MAKTKELSNDVSDKIVAKHLGRIISERIEVFSRHGRLGLGVKGGSRGPGPEKGSRRLRNEVLRLGRITMQEGRSPNSK
ncbi:hypothetical protein J4Q44_G00224330 [Coregonus suidteri]|uniref:Uncharacterized protein n=1 Tax=Coregonus suidteri TaxID=861788 RepID=A0AAN8LIJ9_9TELE